MHTLGKKIRTVRKEAGLTQTALAGAEFTPGFISQLEHGLVQPSLRSLEVLARRLNRPLHFFLTESGEPIDGQTLDLAEKLLEAERLAEAGTLLEPVEGALDQLREGRARALRLLGSLRLRHGEVTEATVLLQEAAAAVPVAEDPMEAARIHHVLAIACDRQQRWEDSLGHLQVALSLLNSHAEADPVLRLKTETNTCIVLCRLERYEEAKYIANGLLQAARTTGLQYRLAELLHTLGYAYFRAGESDQALQCYASSRALYTLFGDRRMLAGVLTHTGIMLGQMGQYTGADAAFAEAAQIFAEAGALVELANARLEQAKCAQAAGDWPVALTRVQEALDGPLAAAERAEAQELLGICHQAGRGMNAAADAFRAAFAGFTELGNRPAAARVARSLGLLLTQTGSPEAGVSWLDQAIALLATTAV